MMKLESTECQALIYAYNNPLKMYYTIILILQTKKLRHQGGRQFVLGHMSRKWKSQDLNLYFLVS